MRAAALHPAQCRTELAPAKGRHTLPGCCGARLDQTGSRRPASPGLTALQDKILGLLEPGGPASTLSAGQPAPAVRLLRRPPGDRAAGLLDLARRPAPEPLRGHRGRHRRARRLAPAANRRPAAASSRLVNIPRQVRLPSRGRRRQRRPGAHRGPRPRQQHRRRPREAAPVPPRQHPGGQKDRLGPPGHLVITLVLRRPAGRIRASAAGIHQGRRPPAGQAQRRPRPSALGPGEHPGVPARRLARQALQADRRRQPDVHPAHRSAPAGPDGRRRLPRRGRGVPRNRDHPCRIPGPDLLRRRPRPLRGQAAARPARLRDRARSPRPRTRRPRHAAGQLPAPAPGPGKLVASTRAPGPR